MTDKVAICPRVVTSWTAFSQIKSDAKFGWQGGDGDIMYLPMPKLDPEYGEKVGISELEGLSGQHSGHVSGLESSHTLFESDDQRVMDAAWKLNVYMQTNTEHVLDIYGSGDPAIPTYQPLLSTLTDEIDVPQLYTKTAESFNEYGGQFMSTGANWDVGGTDEIRWTNINETLTQALAGQHSASEVPSLIRDRITTTLNEQN